MMSIEARLLGCIAVLFGMAGCSLVSIKSPERPLSTRELNTRILTREFSTQFVIAVERCADGILVHEDDPAVLGNTLRWEIGAVAASRRAATQPAPMMSLLDTWALALQMKTFTSEAGPGGALFGKHQLAVRATADDAAEGADALARQLAPPRELDRYRKFVMEYAHEHPLLDLSFARASVVESWSRASGVDIKLVDTLGSIPEAMADVGDRFQIYGDMIPKQVMWKTQLALKESGYSKGDIQSALKQLDERFERLTRVAESAPELVHDTTLEVRKSVLEVLNRVDAYSSSMIETLRGERVALSATVETQRAAVLDAVDVQRKALTLDASRIADQLVRSSGEQMRRLAREVLLGFIVLALIVLGLPFAAGYAVGRARQGRLKQ